MPTRRAMGNVQHRARMESGDCLVHNSLWGFLLSIGISLSAEYFDDAFPEFACLKPWIFWFGVLLGTVSLGTYFFGENISSRFRPRLRLTYRPEAPFIVTVKAGQANSRWFRVRLEGANPSVRVYLTKVERRRDGRFLDQRFGQQQQLAWSTEEGDDCWTAKSVGTDEPLLVDVLWTDEVRSRVIMTWRRDWNENANIFAEPGVYRLTLRAVGEGRARGEIVLRLNWSGAWDDVELIEDRS